MTTYTKLLKKRRRAMEGIRKYDKGMSPAHIAEAMNIPLTTVYHWLRYRKHYELLAAQDCRLLVK